jgi:D-serine deaminase-like pyridoxal phosphate-dependent protein
MNRSEIPTPALTLDLDKFERNLERMAREVARSGRDLRPHFKAHKCIEVAKRQIAAGAVGLCAATVPEAEALHRAGIHNLLLTGPLGDSAKVRRIVQTGAAAVVDHVRQVRWYEEASATLGRKTELLIDLDIGDHRTGAATSEQVLEIARTIAGSPHLHLRGVQAYSVAGSHGADHAARRANSGETFSRARAALALLHEDGHHSTALSGGSTGTWDIDIGCEGFTEMQAGSYAFMDLAYRRIGIDFENALTVQATVISANHSDFVTVDAGFKAFSTDRPFGPEPLAILTQGVTCDMPGAGYRWGGDEFGYVDVKDCLRQVDLGDRIEFIPPHCDPTVNLYAVIYACRGQNVEAVWRTIEKV